MKGSDKMFRLIMWLVVLVLNIIVDIMDMKRIENDPRLTEEFNSRFDYNMITKYALFMCVICYSIDLMN
jgi:hypothetical protein